MKKSSQGYTAMQLALHWGIAVLVLYQLVFGEVMGDLGHYLRGLKESGAQPDPTVLDPLNQGANLHIYVGIAILLLTAIRLLVRLSVGAPEPVPGPALQVKVAQLLHFGFYVLLFAVPVTGLLAEYVSREFGDIHELAKPVFIVFILVHAGAALYHHFVVKDSTLMRMMKPGSL
ncbi:cytochrome b [Oryzibacter oryziterrae]|uniref:cytochrome b n=1 Tax=Oryzibacter oryziterrae TaxID=2766474 RepID=UPI001F2E969F|nr:cytochrome b [Oryzibacter oryziterrae]